MKAGGGGGDTNWYIDIRYLDTPREISLDLSRHLPRRASIGPVAVVAERPLILLSVIRKRWSKIIREVERQYASTLSSDKKKGLALELARLRSFTFAAVSPKTFQADILVLTPAQLGKSADYTTVYVTMPLTYRQLTSVMEHLRPGGLLVTYSGEPETYRQAARNVRG